MTFLFMEKKRKKRVQVVAEGNAPNMQEQITVCEKQG